MVDGSAWGLIFMGLALFTDEAREVLAVWRLIWTKRGEIRDNKVCEQL